MPSAIDHIRLFIEGPLSTRTLDSWKTAHFRASGTWRELLTAAATRHVRPKGAHSPVLKPCVSHDVLERLGDKWTTSVVWLLAEMPGHRLRFSAIRNGIEGITQRMLTVTLRGLERDGLVERHYFPEVPPRVEYELTDLGLGMFQALQEFAGWLSRSWPRIQDTRRDFDGAHRSNAKPAGLQGQGGLASVPIAVKTAVDRTGRKDNQP